MQIEELAYKLYIKHIKKIEENSRYMVDTDTFSSFINNTGDANSIEYFKEAKILLRNKKIKKLMKNRLWEEK